MHYSLRDNDPGLRVLKGAPMGNTNAAKNHVTMAKDKAALAGPSANGLSNDEQGKVADSLKLRDLSNRFRNAYSQMQPQERLGVLQSYASAAEKLGLTEYSQEAFRTLSTLKTKRKGDLDLPEWETRASNVLSSLDSVLSSLKLLK